MTDLYQSTGFDLNPKQLNMEGELWAPLPDYPLYHVSNYGRVRKQIGILYTKPIHKFLNTFPQKTGGMMFMIPATESLTDGATSRRVGRTVLLAFGFPQPEKSDVCYKDNDQTNCRLDNLYWGSKRGGATIDPSIARAIKEALRLEPRKSKAKIAKDFGNYVTPTIVSNIAINRTWVEA